MKISGSIFAVKDNYFEYAKSLQYNNIDYLHIDLFQNNQEEFTLEDILRFDEKYLQLDVHLIYETITEHDIEILNQANVTYLNVQYENLLNKDDIIRISKIFKGYFGISITDQTELKVVDKYINYISQVLIMCSQPGVSGAKFSESNYERIEILKKKYPSLNIYADGGINGEIAEKMESLGVAMVVSGSYLAKNISTLNDVVYSLKYQNEEDICLPRVMIKTTLLPIMDKDANFFNIINTMNKYRMGIVFVCENEKLLGLITDGDIRRAYLKFGKDVFEEVAASIMNISPFVADISMTIKELYYRISINRKGIDIVPVLDNEVLVGAVDLKIGQ